MKKLLAVVAITFAIIALAPPASAAQISEDQAGIISMTCGSVQLQLRNLQKADSKMRVYLGSKYEFILLSLMTPLNLRLVKNNIVSSSLATSQTTFHSEREFFKSAFTDYSKSLDTLIATDCKSNPYDFYDKLGIARTKREVVRQSYLRIKDELLNHRAAVINLGSSL